MAITAKTIQIHTSTPINSSWYHGVGGNGMAGNSGLFVFVWIVGVGEGGSSSAGVEFSIKPLHFFRCFSTHIFFDSFQTIIVQSYFYIWPHRYTTMLPPVRCFTCGKTIPWISIETCAEHKSLKTTMDECGITRICCRRIVISFPSTLEETMTGTLENVNDEALKYSIQYVKKGVRTVSTDWHRLLQINCSGGSIWTQNPFAHNPSLLFFRSTLQLSRNMESTECVTLSYCEQMYSSSLCTFLFQRTQGRVSYDKSDIQFCNDPSRNIWNKSGVLWVRPGSVSYLDQSRCFFSRVFCMAYNSPVSSPVTVPSLPSFYRGKKWHSCPRRAAQWRASNFALHKAHSLDSFIL